MNVLYSWVGNADLQAPRRPERPGPIADMLRDLPDGANEPWAVMLLHDCTPEIKKEGELYFSWLQEQIDKEQKKISLRLRLILKTASTDDPTNYEWVFNAMREAVRQSEEREASLISRHYLVGPGTPTMAACTIILSRMKACTGQLWQTDMRSEKGYRKLELPFDLHLHDAPDPQSTWPQQADDGDTIIRSPATQRAWELAQRAARSSLPVLILGDTGVGKERLAQHIFDKSELKGPFIPINCGAIAASLLESELFGYKKGAFTGANSDKAGVFEQAKDGMVFLDEIGELPLPAQTALLRVLQEKTIRRVGDGQERPVDCRIVAATHRNLWQWIKDGKFRADLYYRLATIIIELADLKDRPEDLSEMISRFWQKITQENNGFPGKTLDEDARQRLRAHSWPGNVRELYATLARASFLAKDPVVDRDTVEVSIGHCHATSPASESPQETIQSFDIPGLGKSDLDGSGLKAMINKCRYDFVLRALKQNSGNKSKAAKMLGITPQHLARILKGES